MIYLDNAATTKPYGEVIDAMVDVMQNHWGNPSAPYALGDAARQIIEEVREQIAKDINCEIDEVIFTSGACEANTLAYSIANCDDAISSKLEHKSLDLINEKYAKLIDNDSNGLISIESLHNTLMYGNSRPFVTIQAANGEIGTIQNLGEISTVIKAFKGVFHTDATQLFPEQRIDVKSLDIDMMSVSAQKFNGPKGIGFLYVRNGIELEPIIYGSQENGLRGGTYNTAAIAGMGEALKITRKFQRIEMNDCFCYVENLRNVLLNRLLQIPGVKLNGAPIGDDRLFNNINITIDGVNAEKLVTLCGLHGVYIGKGSACQSYNPEPSHVLKSIGLTDEQAFNTIRITLGYNNTEEEIDEAAKIITALVERIRQENS